MGVEVESSNLGFSLNSSKRKSLYYQCGTEVHLWCIIHLSISHNPGILSCLCCCNKMLGPKRTQQRKDSMKSIYFGTQFLRQSIEAEKVGTRKKQQRNHTLIHTREAEREKSQLRLKCCSR